MAAPSNELLDQRLETVEGLLRESKTVCADLKDDMAEMKRESIARENKRLAWGVGALGTAVMTLGAILWQNLSQIIR